MKLLVSMIFPLLMQASNIAYGEGRDLYFQKGCGNCHGTQAEGSSYYPKLANRAKSYITRKLTAFREGKSSTQKQEIMFTFAASLKDKEIDNLSTYLSDFQADTSDKYKISDDILGSMD